MSALTAAHRELFRRTPDQCFVSLAELATYCNEQKQHSSERWLPPGDLIPRSSGSDRLVLDLGNDGAFLMNDWSFTQLCQLSHVGKETVNRLSADTAARVLQETLPQGNKPVQVFTLDNDIRSVHGVSYTRLHNADLVALISEFATDFEPPPLAASGGTGLYAGEQDMFCFLIDPTGWAEIDGQAFAPGFFLWNSEVGKRSLGVQTFWFQKVCQNHIVWDAVEVVEFARKHTANIHEALSEIRRILERLVQKRDERRDGFVKLIRQAMNTRLGEDREEVEKLLAQSDISRALARRALDLAEEQQKPFTVFTVVDALTRLTQEMPNAGERTDADQRAAALLTLGTAWTLAA